MEWIAGQEHQGTFVGQPAYEGLPMVCGKVNIPAIPVISQPGHCQGDGTWNGKHRPQG